MSRPTLHKLSAVLGLFAAVAGLLVYVGLYSATHGPSGRYFVTAITAYTERDVGWGQLPFADRFALHGVSVALERSEDGGCAALLFLNHRVDGGVSEETARLTLELMRYMVNEGAVLYPGCGTTIVPPLWNAVSRLHLERVQILMDAGADPDSVRGWLGSDHGYGTLAQLLDLRRQRAAGRPQLLATYDLIEEMLWSESARPGH
jgi:hypothetical protein